MVNIAKNSPEEIHSHISALNPSEPSIALYPSRNTTELGINRETASISEYDPQLSLVTNITLDYGVNDWASFTASPENTTRERALPQFTELLEDRRMSNEERYFRFQDLLAVQGENIKQENPAPIVFRLSRILAAINVWGFRGSILPKIEPPVEAAITSLVESGTKTLEYLSTSDVIKFTWGVSHLNRREPELFDHAAEILTPAIRHLSGSQISNIAEAFAYAKRTAPTLFTAIAERMAEGMSSWRPHDIASICLSAHTLRVSDPRIMDSAERENAKPGRFCDQRDRVSLIWTAAASYLPSAPQLLRDFLEDMRQTKRIPFASGLPPLYQACLATGTEIPWWLAKEMETQSPFRSDYNQVRLSKLNNFESSIYKTLRRIDEISPIAIHSHRSIAGFIVDFELAVRSESGAKRLVCLECDGVQYHYLNARVADGLTGTDVFREKIIKSQGYKFVRINTEEWYETYQRAHLPVLAERIGVKLPRRV